MNVSVLLFWLVDGFAMSVAIQTFFEGSKAMVMPIVRDGEISVYLVDYSFKNSGIWYGMADGEAGREASSGWEKLLTCGNTAAAG